MQNLTNERNARKQSSNINMVYNFIALSNIGGAREPVVTGSAKYHETLPSRTSRVMLSSETQGPEPLRLT